MVNIKVADEVWIATAMLHWAYPDREDFAEAEIVEQARSEKVTSGELLRPGVKIHINSHCVAQKTPNRGRYRMLTETAKGRRRLYRPGDSCHRERINGKGVPELSDIPTEYHHLIEWYRQDYARNNGAAL